jgi:hypothetical protein
MMAAHRLLAVSGRGEQRESWWQNLYAHEYQSFVVAFYLWYKTCTILHRNATFCKYLLFFKASKYDSYLAKVAEHYLTKYDYYLKKDSYLSVVGTPYYYALHGGATALKK